MSIRISHQGMFNNGGTPFALAAALVVAVGQQATFAHYGKLGARTANQGEIELAEPGQVAVGAFVDVSPKGDTCTIETEGYEWIKYSGAVPAVADLVTVAAGGLVAKTAGAAPTAAELLSGVWQVDAVDTVNAKVLLNVETRL